MGENDVRLGEHACEHHHDHLGLEHDSEGRQGHGHGHSHECHGDDEHAHVHEHGHEHDHGHGHDHDHDYEHEACHHHDHGHGCRSDHDHDHDHGTCDGHGCSCGCCDDDCAEEPRVLGEAPSFSYHVLGIDCPSCARSTQNAVRLLASVEDARLVYATATLEVVAAHGVALDECRREVLVCVRSCGQDLELGDDERLRLEADRPWYAEHREQVLMGTSGMALALGLVIDHLVGSETRAIPCYVIAALAGLVFIAPMAWASLRRRTADMNVLMAIAVVGGLIMGALGDHSVFGDAAIVIFLDQVGEWLEGWSMRKTSGSIRELMDLTPPTAHVLDESGHMSDVRVADIEEGVRIRVLPGERVPLDGTICAGSSSFNEAPVTGEGIPQDKSVGQEVYAGSLNTTGVVELEVTADEDCTTLARIISMVQGAQAEKAPYEGFVDRFAAAYTPVVIAGALVVGVAVPLVLSLVRGFDATLWHDWVYRALSLLVVACPCALVISTPVSFVSGLTRAAKNGVLVKGGAYFDIATKVDTIAFDKTGTLTTGRPVVVQVQAFDAASEDEVLRIAGTLEESSTHPLARAVVACALEREIWSVAATEVEEHASNGMRAQIDGIECLVGKLAFAKKHAQVPPEVDEAVRSLGDRGATALVVCSDGRAIGVLGVADTIRAEVPEAMQALSQEGVREREMLTGDNGHAAAAIAQQAHMTTYAAELLPDEKVEHVREAQRAGHVVAMVGDGINDAPALATADLGITLGAAASDTALEVADVALLSDDLTQLPAFFALARKTMRVVRENIAFAIGVKALVFVLVILGVAGMGAAVFADTGVALIVVLNGMRLMLGGKARW